MTVNSEGACGDSTRIVSRNRKQETSNMPLARQFHKAASVTAALLIAAAYGSCLLQLAGLA
jgi:hypothetical protein